MQSNRSVTESTLPISIVRWIEVISIENGTFESNRTSPLLIIRLGFYSLGAEIFSEGAMAKSITKLSIAMSSLLDNARLITREERGGGGGGKLRLSLIHI